MDEFILVYGVRIHSQLGQQIGHGASAVWHENELNMGAHLVNAGPSPMGGCPFHSGQSSVRLSRNILTGTSELFHTNALGVLNLTKLTIEIKHQPQRGSPHTPKFLWPLSDLAMPYRPVTTCNCVFMCFPFSIWQLQSGHVVLYSISQEMS